MIYPLRDAAISISFSADHKKGDGQILDARDHFQMLASTIRRYRSMVDWPIVVCASASGHLEIEGINRLITIPENPGYPEGATWAIRQGICAAHSFGCRFLIHTCEDVVPVRGTIEMMVQQMDEDGLDYIGERWREDELSTQFFGCRVKAFVGFKEGGEDGLLVEAYMKKYIRFRPHKTMSRSYKHTHTPSDFFKFLEEE